MAYERENMSEEEQATPDEQVIDVETNDNVSNEEVSNEANDPTPDQVEAEKKVKAQAAFNKQYGEKKQFERERDAARQELEQLRSEQQQQNIIDVPAPPDPYDDDYEVKLKERDNAIAKKAEQTSHSAFVEQQRTYTQQQQQNALVQDIRSKADSYAKKAAEIGIDPAKLQQSAATVSSYGMSDDLTIAILGDQDGPILTQYLAANPMEIETLSTMSPFQQAHYLEKNIRPKAIELKPKSSNAPQPATNISGGGVKSDDHYQNLKGAKFE